MQSPLDYTKDSPIADWIRGTPNKMVLRRSFIGSLRSAASFSSSPLSISPRIEQTPTRKQPNRSTRVVQPAHQGLRLRPPELEQSIVSVSYKIHIIDMAGIFESCLAMTGKPQCNHSLFQLPGAIKLRIYDYCFPENCCKINLSPEFVTRGGLHSGPLGDPFEALRYVCGGLEAFRALRHELLTYFWTHFHFHVTISPFTGPKFSPLSCVWLKDYLPIVQNLTIEVDFTKFGGGLLEGASDYGFLTERMDHILMDVMLGLSKRRHITIMKELNLFCRRYAGTRRPVTSATELTYDSSPYCPELAILICDSVSELQGILQKLTLGGFTKDYTELLMQSVFGSSRLHLAEEKKLCLAATSDPHVSPAEVDERDTAQKSKQMATSLMPPPDPCDRCEQTTTAENYSIPRVRSNVAMTAVKQHIIAPCPQTPIQSPKLPIPITASSQISLKSIIRKSSFPLSIRSLSLTSFRASESPSPHSSCGATIPLFGPYTNLDAARPMDYKLKLTRSRSFQEEFEGQILGSQSCTLDLSNSRSSPASEPPSETDIVERNAEVSNSNIDKNVGVEPRYPLQTKQPANDKDHEAECGTGSELKCTPSQTTKALLFHKTAADTINIVDKKSSNLPSESARCLTPTQPRHTVIQNSPNTMNTLNEQDPAFVRTIHAMKKLRQSRKETMNGDNSPSTIKFRSSDPGGNHELDRSVTGLSNRSNSSGRRYFTFVNIIRGREARS